MTNAKSIFIRCTKRFISAKLRFKSSFVIQDHSWQKNKLGSGDTNEDGYDDKLFISPLLMI